MTRDYDVHLLGTADSANRLSLSVAADAMACFGAPAAVQQFIALLFSSKGSDAINEDSGTDFIRSIRSGQYTSEHEISMLFLNCATDAISQLAGLNGNNVDEDERVVKASVTSVRFTVDSVDIAANLELQSGSSTKVVMPVRWAAA